MYQLTPYLFFSGRCEEALDFYTKCFGGVVLTKQRFKDAPVQIEGAEPNWVMHAEIEAFGLKLMLSDGVVARELSGNNVALSLVFDDLDEQARVYDKLLEGGHIMRPLEDAFWGGRFGKVEDQFGVRWILHCDLVK
ncbi:VOC family protein [Vibrio aquaticus]|uniref:VOC family protein n=1 Tax=Vibrio aquaticus TaxID=2496559 RepID=A0A3S0N2T0_9VIBR|nr:VOC family protein [Vibrio aquaticus]RTZ13526.1 VOC family protein [Vibrio aquaticus]